LVGSGRGCDKAGEEGKRGDDVEMHFEVFFDVDKLVFGSKE
jgi:hypothetical protein